MIKHRRFLVVTMILVLCISLLSACTFSKSNEELIESRINSFLKAYNSGDMDAVLECLDAKTKNTYKATMNIGNALIGKTGFDVKLSDLFGIGVGTMSEGDILTVELTEINLLSETDATVTVKMSYKDKIDEFSDDAVFTMLKENNNWYIQNFESK